MAVYYKFKSAKEYETIPVDGHFISVSDLKQKIVNSKRYGCGKDFDIIVTNAQTDEEYTDESALIAKNTTVLIRRIPGVPRMPIVAAQVTEEGPVTENNLEHVQPQEASFSGFEQSALKLPNDSEWDGFGDDLYSIHETVPQSVNLVQHDPLLSKADEDSKIKALIDTPALSWQSQPGEGFGPGQSFGRNAWMMNARNSVRPGFERRTPPPGYVCHRCNVPGHLIQHCPTNGDPNYDIKRVKPPTGIPKSMLMPTSHGSYVLPSGASAVLNPNEAAFEKAMEGLPSTRLFGDVPPELRCPLCKEVMKEAVLTSKCCFSSFCDKCIRSYTISNSMCVCGATNVLADDLLPNKTLRDTINRILESSTSSTEKSGSANQVQDMESHNPESRIPSPTQSASSGGVQELLAAPHRDKTSKMQDTAEEGTNVSVLTQETYKEKDVEAADVPETINESVSVKEQDSQESTVLPDEVLQKPATVDPGKVKKKKKEPVPLNGEREIQWRMDQGLGVENYMSSVGPTPTAYGPYWGMQPGFEGGFQNPYGGGMLMPPPYMSYGGDHSHGGQGWMFPTTYGIGELEIGFNSASRPTPPPPRPPPAAAQVRGQEFEARETEGRRGSSKDREIVDKAVKSSGGGYASPAKLKYHHMATASDHNRHRSQSLSTTETRSEDPRHSRSSSNKRKSNYYDGSHSHHRDYDDYDYHRRSSGHRNHDDYDYHRHSSGHRSGSSASSAAKASSGSLVDNKHRSIPRSPPLPQGGAFSKKRKLSSFGDVDDGDEERNRHFKRRARRYEASPLPVRAA